MLAGCQVTEPEGVGMPRAVRATASWCSDVAPAACAWRTMGSTSAARARACPTLRTDAFGLPPALLLYAPAVARAPHTAAGAGS